MPVRASEQLLPTSIRLSRQELELLQRAARAVDLSVSAFMRQKVLGAARELLDGPTREGSNVRDE
jgi:uncharacterized protein (DUF1778 family)